MWLRKEMEELVVEEEVEVEEMEEVVVEEMEEVVVVTPLGSFLSSKTATDMAVRFAPQLGNSVSCCAGAGREEPPWCFFHCLLSPFLDMLSPGTALIACDSDFPSRTWVKAMAICLFAFPERDPSVFLPIVNL